MTSTNNVDVDGDEYERNLIRKWEQAERDPSLDSSAYRAEVARLALLSELDYQIERKPAAKRLNGISVAVLDRLVREARKEAGKTDAFDLPHWKVEPWPEEVSGADLLDALRAVFQKYIYAPSVVADVSALWVLHAWTIDAGDISPFFVLVSPTKRCGKTSMLIILMYLTPRSELASNISPSALFRYVEHVHPTLLIDEADSFVGESEEMRGILNSGHTRVAANVIRNVELNGEHLPRRFSVWAPKAIATIRDLADTLEDRAIVIQLQRKPRTAQVARLRKRDCAEFATLRRKAARWAKDNFVRLVDPDPDLPEELNDRAADNWRPLIALADAAGGDWPRRAREAACVLSGAGHDSKSINVECLADVRLHFKQDAAMRSADLVEDLNADPERPWATWAKGGKPLTQKHLANLLRPFGIISETVHIDGLAHAKGYRRERFEEAWAAYLDQKSGQNDLRDPSDAFYPCNRANPTAAGTSDVFASVQEGSAHGCENGKLPYGHAGLHPCTDRNVQPAATNGFDQKSATSSETLRETFPRVCELCGSPERDWDPLQLCAVGGEEMLLHKDCQKEAMS